MLKLLPLLIDFLKFMRDKFPPLFSAGIIIYDAMANKIKALDIEVWKLKLELKEKENREKVYEANKGKTATDIINDILKPSDSSGNGSDSGGKPS